MTERGDLPHFWRHLVGLCIGRRRAGSVLVELDGEFAERRRAATRRAARRWYRREALSLVVWYGRARLTRRRSAVRIPQLSPRPTTMLSDFLFDVRLAIRSLRHQPSFSAIAIISLALGIGSTSAMYTIVDRVLLRPLPYEEPEQLVRVWLASREDGAHQLDAAATDYLAFQQRAATMDHVAAFSLVRRNLLDEYSTPTQTVVARCLSDPFVTLGVAPLVGRGFSAREMETGAAVVLLDHRLWTRRYGADTAIIGKFVVVDRVEHEVVGVLPATQRYPRDVMVWRPATVEEQDYVDDDRELVVIARLAAGFSVHDASRELDGIAAQLATEFPETNTDIGAWAQPLRTTLVGDVRPPLVMLMAAVGLVLTIVCANVACLFLARAAGSAHEIAVRSALGAGRGRLVRHALTESLVIGAVGGGLGILGASQALTWLIGLLPADMPRQPEIALDARVLALMAVATILSALICGVLPAAQVTRWAACSRPGGRRMTAGRGHTRMRGALVVAEVALAVVLTTGACLMITSFARLSAVDRGFVADRLLAIGIDLPDEHDSGVDPVATYDAIAARVGALPGVVGVALGLTHPLEPRGVNLRVFAPEGLPERSDAPRAVVRVVGPDYFRTTGIPVLAGRPLDAGDREDAAGVAVVNQAFARGWSEGQTPLGSTFEFPWRARGSTFQIVGVVGDVTTTVGQEAVPALYLSHRQIASFGMRLMVRTAVPPATLIGAIRTAVWDVAPGTPLQDLATMEQLVAAQADSPRFTMRLLVAFAGASLALASIGVYGLIAFGVSRRRRELGIRHALGADADALRRLVLWESLRLTGLGVGIGLTLALALAQLIRANLHGVSPSDPGIAVVSVLIVGVTAMLGALAPAVRATRIDPRSALASD